MTIRIRTRFVLAVTLGATCLPSSIHSQGLDFDSIELETFELARDLYVLIDGPAQGNIVASVGDDGIFLVDSMYAPMHQNIIDALAQISPQPVRFVVNTHMHGDHTAGSAAMADLGTVVIAHENMRPRLLSQSNPPSEATLPVINYADSMKLHFNGEEIFIHNSDPTQTDHDLFIYFCNANVMPVGDVSSSLRYPNIGVNDGGAVAGMMAAARQIMEIANRDTKIIPGHLGPVVGFDEIEQQLQMFVVVRDRVLTAIRGRQMLEQVVVSKPTADFDAPRLAGAITPDLFVTLVYTDLARQEE